jgi:hypothetical protein
MPWETRRGRRYYYRKRRQGDRVVSEYVGAGEAAEIAAQLDALAPALRLRQAERWASRRARDARVDEIAECIDALVCGVLLAAGHHTHKGQWRKKRHA